MKHCSNCHSMLEDDAAFCVYCGTKIDTNVPTGPTCPNCHAPIEDGATFCVYCGTKLESATTNNHEDIQRLTDEGAERVAKEEERIENEEERKLSSKRSLEDYVSQKDAEYERERKERNQVLLFGFVIILLVGLVGGGVYYCMQDDTIEENIDVVEAIDEPENIIAEEEEEEFDIEEFRKDVLVALSNTLIVKSNFLILTFKDDYEATEITNGHSFSDEEPAIASFQKGQVICNSYSLGYYMIEPLEYNGANGYNVGVDQCGDVFVPAEVVYEREEMVGCIDLKVLDIATLHFKSDDNRTCTLYKLKKNGNNVRYANGIFDGRIITEDIYCLESDTRLIILLENGENGMDSNSFYRNEDKVIDRSHTLQKDIELNYGCSRCSTIYYIPSKRTLLRDGRQYKLTEIEPNN